MKNDEKWDGELSHLSVLGWAVLFTCAVLVSSKHLTGKQHRTWATFSLFSSPAVSHIKVRKWEHPLVDHRVHSQITLLKVLPVSNCSYGTTFTEIAIKGKHSVVKVTTSVPQSCGYCSVVSVPSKGQSFPGITLNFQFAVTGVKWVV